MAPRLTFGDKIPIELETCRLRKTMPPTYSIAVIQFEPQVRPNLGCRLPGHVNSLQTKAPAQKLTSDC